MFIVLGLMLSRLCWYTVCAGAPPPPYCRTFLVLWLMLVPFVLLLDLGWYTVAVLVPPPPYCRTFLVLWLMLVPPPPAGPSLCCGSCWSRLCWC